MNSADQVIQVFTQKGYTTQSRLTRGEMVQMLNSLMVRMGGGSRECPSMGRLRGRYGSRLQGAIRRRVSRRSDRPSHRHRRSSARDCSTQSVRVGTCRRGQVLGRGAPAGERGQQPPPSCRDRVVDIKDARRQARARGGPALPD